MTPTAQRLIFTDRWASRKRAAVDFVYRYGWIPAAVLLLAIWHHYK